MMLDVVSHLVKFLVDLFVKALRVVFLVKLIEQISLVGHDRRQAVLNVIDTASAIEKSGSLDSFSEFDSSSLLLLSSFDPFCDLGARPVHFPGTAPRISF